MSGPLAEQRVPDNSSCARRGGAFNRRIAGAVLQQKSGVEKVASCSLTDGVASVMHQCRNTLPAAVQYVQAGVQQQRSAHGVIVLHRTVIPYLLRSSTCRPVFSSSALLMA